MRGDVISLWGNELGMRGDVISLWGNELGMRGDVISLWDNVVGMRDDVILRGRIRVRQLARGSGCVYTVTVLLQV